MISVYNIKPKFQALLKPVLVLLHRLNVTANMITWMAIFLSLGGGIVFWIHPFGKTMLLIPIILLVRMALNALDGMMARTYNMQSKSGEMLNELGDVVSDLFLFLPLLQLDFLDKYIVLTFLFLSVINEFSGVIGKVITGERRYEGPMGKSDRAFLVGLFCLIYFFWNKLSDYGNYVFIGASVLLLLSTFIRIRKTLK